MYSYFQWMFNFLSQQHTLSLVTFLVSSFLFVKFYDSFLRNNLIQKLNFIKSGGNENFFVTFLCGVTFLLVVFILILLHLDYPLVWLVLSVGYILGGILGLMPYSFIKNIERPKKSKEKREKGTLDLP